MQATDDDSLLQERIMRPRTVRNWTRILRRIQMKKKIMKGIQYYETILSSCACHTEDLYDKRLIRRYVYNDTTKLILTAHEEIKRLTETPVGDLLRRGPISLFRPLITLVEKAVFTVGLPNCIELLEYLGAKQPPEEHLDWLRYSAKPCLVSHESGPCRRFFFRNITMTNPNSYVDNLCVWASVPLTSRNHLAVKLMITRDPLNLIKTAFNGRIRLLEPKIRSLIWTLHPRYIIACSTSEIRTKIYNLIRTRERIGKTPVGKIIKEFINADSNRRVSLFCAMCVPKSAITHEQSTNDTDSDDNEINPRNYTAGIQSPFRTRDRIPRTPDDRQSVRFSNTEDSDVDNREDIRNIGRDSPTTVETNDDSDVENLPDGELDPLLSTVYDLVANHSVINRRDVVDSIDLLPWEVQKRVRKIRDHVMKSDTIHEDEIPDETRLQMLPIDETTKQTVISRIREARTRNSDSSTKAASWVSGFFRIPLGIFRREPILMRREKTTDSIGSILGENIKGFQDILKIFIHKYSEIIVHKRDYRGLFWSNTIITESLKSIRSLETLKEIASDLGIDVSDYTRQGAIDSIKAGVDSGNLPDAAEFYAHVTSRGGKFPADKECKLIGDTLNRWYSHRSKLAEGLRDTKNVLDKCVRFQENAKSHVLRVLGQWMVGKDSGYCLGFEGPPGVGKTTLAREGLAKILCDEDGNTRPFKMIALGTATTGSTLVGHNYTYQSSQWGDIVRILMECECMNPIIYVDELDKVSKTENGKEIISILTHLTDPAQNEEFQDRYFAGVKLDMSKVLFVFSYNDPSLIDPILLDRIHRIRFDSLTTHEKLSVIRKHTLPDIANDLNLPIEDGSPCEICIADDVLRNVIHKYTNEAGLRKIREILYDTFREINLSMIHAGNNDGHIKESDGLWGNATRNIVSLEFIEDVILRHRTRMEYTRVDGSDIVSHTRVYGMFATQSGIGGVLPIRVSEDYGVKDPDSFPVRVTGSLGNVMKESVEIARTVCLSLLKEQDMPSPKMGIHIHFPEGATPKDGPSAGTAICLALYSFIRELPIPGDITITGEIDLDGKVLRVGGIPEKLTGAKCAGATRSIIPYDNQRELDILLQRIPDTEVPLCVHPVKTIHEAIRLVTTYDNIRESSL